MFSVVHTHRLLALSSLMVLFGGMVVCDNLPKRVWPRRVEGSICRVGIPSTLLFINKLLICRSLNFFQSIFILYSMTLIAGPGRGLGEVGRDISSERRSAKFNTRIQQKIKIRIKGLKSLY